MVPLAFCGSHLALLMVSRGVWDLHGASVGPEYRSMSGLFSTYPISSAGFLRLTFEHSSFIIAGIAASGLAVPHFWRTPEINRPRRLWAAGAGESE